EAAAEKVLTGPEVEELLTSLGLLQPELEGPIQIVNLALTVQSLFQLENALTNPLRIAPTLKDLVAVQGLLWGPSTLGPLPMASFIGLDLLDVSSGSDLGFRGPLTLNLEGCGVLGGFLSGHDSKQLLTEDELNSLKGRRSYLIVPKRPFSATATCP